MMMTPQPPEEWQRKVLIPEKKLKILSKDDADWTTSHIICEFGLAHSVLFDVKKSRAKPTQHNPKEQRENYVLALLCCHRPVN